MKSQKTEDVDVQTNLFVHCPKVSFKFTRATLCKGCEHFCGIMKVSEDKSQVKSLRVYCGHPVTRSLVEVEVD